jgi:hypothetical protein
LSHRFFEIRLEAGNNFADGVTTLVVYARPVIAEYDLIDGVRRIAEATDDRLGARRG